MAASSKVDDLRHADFISNLAAYLSQLSVNPFNLHTLAHVREQTRNSSAEEYPSRDTGVWDAALDPTSFDNTDPRFWKLHQELLQVYGPKGLLGVLENNNLTTTVVPTSLAAFAFSVIGSPVVTVPLGYFPADTETTPEGGLVYKAPSVPFGLSFLGKPWSEADLIGMAYAYEQETQVRGKVKPLERLTPKTEVACQA